MVSRRDNSRWALSAPQTCAPSPQPQTQKEQGRQVGCLGGAGYSQGTQGTFQVCGRTSKVMSRLGSWVVNNTDPSSVILISKRLKALSFFSEGLSQELHCSTAQPGVYLALMWFGPIPGENLAKLPTALGMSSNSNPNRLMRPLWWGPASLLHLVPWVCLPFLPLLLHAQPP